MSKRAYEVSVSKTELTAEPPLPNLFEYIFTITECDPLLVTARLTANFFPETREIDIEDFNVSKGFTDSGRGKALLKELLEESRRIGAVVIEGSPIISRECLDAVSAVFGREHVDVRVVGEYGESDTHAHLVFPVEAS